ncbi:glycosyltransferase family 2 protein [Granulosicoccaceae sp. 1_MG-2023]|nr:glycosyltransferase family 2 protein [Granulosicoccaceae sp. 1_MG-2023]
MSVLRYLAGAFTTDYTRLVSPPPAPAGTWQLSAEVDLCLCLRVRGAMDFFAGWYMVEMQLSHSSGASLKSELSFENTNASGLKLSVLSGKMAKRLVRLNGSAAQLQLQIRGADGQVSLEHLRIVPVTRNFALKRMLKRVRANSSRYCVSSDAELREAIIRDAGAGAWLDELMALYDQTFYNEHDEHYEHWIAAFEKPRFQDAQKLRREIDGFALRPRISLIMPVYNIDARYLQAAIESVRAQVYDNWQLCIVDDASPAAHIRPLLEDYAARDPRITVAFHKQNQHIAAASNTALAMADGDFVGFLDHDDLLPRHALFAVVEAINANQEAQIFYSDEDKINDAMTRQSPYFKPAFNQDLLYSYNYFCHLTVMKRSLLNGIGGLREGVDGSQDFDLVLRAVAQAGRDKVVHIPHVLYHWRMVNGSTASSEHAKSYTSQAGIRALQDYFAARGENGIEVLPGPRHSTYRIKRPLPSPAPLVSLIIPTRNGLELLKACVDSIRDKTTYPNYEILIVDNQSDDPATLAWLSRVSGDERVRVIAYDAPFNYSAINNFAVGQARGEIIGLINNDIEVINGDWLSELVSNALREEVGCVGAKLLYGDGTVQHAGVVLGLGGVAGHAFKGFGRDEPGYFNRAQLQQCYSAVTAACLVVRKAVFEEVGGLDEEHFRVAFNDVDFCLKVRQAGYDNVWTPWAELYHHESKSRGYEDTPEKVRRFQGEIAAMKLRWGRELRRDPAYSPNLTDRVENFSIRV